MESGWNGTRGDGRSPKKGVFSGKAPFGVDWLYDVKNS